jgi:osmoprotectant transport system ATP-binding protein
MAFTRAGSGSDERTLPVLHVRRQLVEEVVREALGRDLAAIQRGIDDSLAPASAPLDGGLGYVIQDGGLFPHLSGRDNVALLARQLGRDAGWIRSRVAELADLVRLPTAALDRPPGAISGGQRQRLGIMRALMLDPAVVLLDEPLGALDPLVRYDLQEDLRRIFRDLGKTVVLVTHDMGEAGFFGDDVVLLGGGAVVQRGTLDDLITAPADESVRRFIMAHRLPGVATEGGGA